MRTRCIDTTSRKLLEILGLDELEMLISADVHLRYGEFPTVTTVSYLAPPPQHIEVTQVFDLHLRTAQQPADRAPLNLDNLCTEARARLASHIWHAGKNALAAMDEAKWERAEHYSGLLREVVEERLPIPF